jgi:hypothetical protein
VLVTADGGAFKYSNMMTFHLGCSPFGITVTEDPLFEMYKVMNVTQSNLDLYEIIPPSSVFPTYCPIIKYEPVNIKLAGIGKPGYMISSLSCDGI